jgi:hypothetical protein
MACRITFFAEGAKRNSSRWDLYSRLGDADFLCAEGMITLRIVLYGNSPCLARAEAHFSDHVLQYMRRYEQLMTGAELNHRHTPENSSTRLRMHAHRIERRKSHIKVMASHSSPQNIFTDCETGASLA